MDGLDLSQTRPHWWGQVRYRRCTIYFALLVGGLVLVARHAMSVMMIHVIPRG